MNHQHHDRGPHGQDHAKPSAVRYWPVLAAFLGLALFLLWEEHQAHIIGVLPWVLILVLCPLMHLFMHGGHGGHGGQGGHGGHHDSDRED